ncbi:YqiJ family protein [Sphingomonas sp. NPDC092331]|uniref:YqiJ family protein n=1 Tax=unclassified Sphingomonas TaxID=196159 RepID=UPI002456F9B6|nr:YqiJ family protein [Sphingomonas sp. CBMAI 2297]MCH7860945.1 YqiJ family protein [Pseudomonadota bacterium]MDH4745391.1 YqiJ family protein [Sphingomonas sp. CBMAI 2297]
MLAFLLAEGNFAFVVAVLLMLLIGLVQVIGFGHDVDADLHADVHGDLHFDFLSWLGIGRLPLLMLIVIFLAVFGVGGLMLQQLLRDWTGAPLPMFAAVPLVGVAALPVTGLAARLLAPILPRDHTTAVPLEVLIGTTAQIVTGRASQGSPARARAQDHHGQVHYVMVEPDGAGQVFQEGEQVLLVRREGECFRAISRGDFYLPRLDG